MRLGIFIIYPFPLEGLALTQMRQVAIRANVWENATRGVYGLEPRSSVVAIKSYL